MKDPAWIVASWRQREAAQDPEMSQRRKIRDHYQGDTIIAMPEMELAQRPAIANLAMIGIDQTAQRIAETLPTVYFPATRPAVQSSVDRSNVRRKATLGWWDRNRLDVKMRRRARQLVAYSAAPVLLRPNFELGIPQWDVRDPLTCYPAPTGDPDELRPTDCIFAYQRSAGFVRQTWPQAYGELRRKSSQQDTDQLTIVEYVDGEEWVLVAVGDSSTPDRSMPFAGFHTPDGMLGFAHEVLLERTPSKVGVCPVVIPGRITLGRPQGQFDQTLPMYTVQARMQALLNIAVEKSIYPDAYLVGDSAQNPVFVSGPFDGRTGQVNVVKGGKIEYINSTPSPITQQAINELERNQRVMSGVSPDMGGESGGNIRTGRRGDAILSTQIDPGVQEAHEVFQASLEEENRIAIAIAKAYFGNRPQSFYVRWRNAGAGGTGPVDYVPNRDFENDNNIVMYPHAGSDQASLTIGLGQRLGEGLISKRTAQDLDPMIADGERERDQVTKEQIEAALLQAFLAQVQQGAVPMADAARISDLVWTNKTDLAGAIAKVHAEAQARQATDPNAQPGDPSAPVDPNSPAAQPGLSQPGMGAEAGSAPVIPPPGQSQVNLSDLLNTLRRPQRMSPAERGAA